ncbi:MAG: ABC transporter substrate-binding protein [Pseudomonadota bacterium]
MPLFFLTCLCAAALHIQAAEPDKVIRLAFPSAETRFDPGAEADQVSLSICENIFEPLLKYDYLARPIKLVPNTAERMPEVLDNGATYILRIKPGIYFTPDPAFGNKRRELIATDYAFSLKRMLDPNVRSRWNFVVQGKFIGSDELLGQTKKTGTLDYDAPLAGLEIVDRYTLAIRLKQPDYNMLYILAMPATGAMAREVVEHYGTDIGAHPIGTGPYMLSDWRRSSKIVLTANPDFRGEYLNTRYAGDDPMDKQIVQGIRGKRLPLVGRIEAYIIEEDQPRWLAFLNNEHDYVSPIPRDFADLAMPNGEVSPALAKRGIYAAPDEEPYTTYTMFNMSDPVVGGYTPEKVALRRAISLAYDVDAEIHLLRKNQAIKADSPIPPGMAGFDPNFRNPVNIYSPAKAKALLDLFGYIDRDDDGYRELPNGQPLSVEFASTPTLASRQLDELWKKNMNAIGIRLTFKKAPLPELREAARLAKIQMFSYGWIGDYPDGENFLQLFYSKNIGQANYAQFNLPAYDQLYEKAQKMPDSPERTRLYTQLTKMIIAYGPWRIGVYPRQHHLVQPWVKGYKKHPMQNTSWLYLDVDLALREKSLGNLK